MTTLNVAIVHAAPIPLAIGDGIEKAERVHVAAWPTVREKYAHASRHYAMEGRCFVLAAGLVQKKDDLFDGLERAAGGAAAKELVEVIDSEALNRGGSMIIAPGARIVAQAGEGEEELFADLDLGEIGQGLASLDSDGHYSRPEVFELRVDTSTKDGIKWS